MTEASLYKSGVEHSNDYQELLRINNLNFTTETIFYNVGDPVPEPKHIVFFSVIHLQYSAFLEEFIPLASSHQLSFSMIRNTTIVKQINDGHFGKANIGKIITLFLTNESESQLFQTALLKIASNYIGPHIPNLGRVSGCLYGNKFLTANNLNPIPNQNIYDSLPPKYRNIKIVTENFKGNTLEAELNIGDGVIQPCIIKEAGYNMLWDDYGRSMKDRLERQKDLLVLLKDKIKVPKYLDYFELCGQAYLVTEKNDGMTFLSIIREAHKNYNSWWCWNLTLRKSILHSLIKLIDQIYFLHNLGYIHGDIHPDNFLVEPDGNLILIDTETFYSPAADYPSVPFDFGTPGFQSPMKIGQHSPSYEDDIYSIGATIFLALTGLNPITVGLNTSTYLPQSIEYFLPNRVITDLVLSTTNPDPSKRPSLLKIKEVLVNQSFEILKENGENDARETIQYTLTTKTGRIIEQAIDSLPWQILLQPDNTLKLNLNEKNSNLCTFHGLLNGNLGIVFTLIRAMHFGFKVPVSSTYIENYLNKQIEWHMDNFQYCNKSFSDGTLGLAVLATIAISTSTVPFNDIYQRFILNSISAPLENEDSERADYYRIATISYCKALIENTKFHEELDRRLFDCINRFEHLLNLYSNNNGEIKSNYSLFRSALALYPHLNSKRSVNTCENIKLTITKQLNETYSNYKQFGFSYKNEIVYNNYIKLAKILLFSRSDIIDPFIFNHFERIQSTLPTDLTHNNYCLQNGISFFGELFQFLYIKTQNKRWKSCANRIATTLVALLKNDPHNKAHWIPKHRQWNNVSITSGNCGIINFLMDNQTNRNFPMCFIP